MEAILGLAVKVFPTVCKVARWFLGTKPNRGTVLVIEDDANDALILERALRKVGYECEIASSAEVARGVLLRSNFSIIFIDLRLPGMSGEAFLRVLSKESPTSRLIVVCGEPSDLRSVEEGKPIILIKKGVNVLGLTELFEMLKVR